MAASPPRSAPPFRVTLPALPAAQQWLCLPDSDRGPVSVCLCSCAARTGPSDVHHPQAGGPLLPWTQGGERGGRALPLGSAARPGLLHHGHTAGAARPGAGHRVRHARAAGPREPGSAHAQGQEPGWECRDAWREDPVPSDWKGDRPKMGRPRRMLAEPYGEPWAFGSSPWGRGCSHWSVQYSHALSCYQRGLPGTLSSTLPPEALSVRVM